ncbi:MAG: glycosyltransferase family 4 protein [Anaerolineae bacterium]|nr:glycosyltransferase family 4 protein [Anaerolineae bacterium]
MKILQIVQKPQRRGAEVFAFQLNRELGRRGHEVSTIYLYAYHNAAPLPLHRQDHRFDGLEAHPAELLLGVQPKLLYRLQNVIETFKPDIVQVNGGRAVKYGAFSRYLGRNGTYGLIYRNIGDPKDWVHGWQRRLLYKKIIMPQIDGVVGVSQVTLQRVQDYYGLSVPTMYIPNGIDTAALCPATDRLALRRQLQTPADAPVLIFVGSLTKEKRPDRLLRVFQQVQAKISSARLWIVGGGSLRSVLEQQAQTMGLANVNFLGVQSEVASLLNAADLFVLTSDTEGIPAVVLEAGASGLPVVATCVGGLAECVTDGQTGYLLPPQDESGQVQAILSLLQQPEQRRRMGQAAKQWVQTTFSIEHITQQYLNFYNRVLTCVQESKAQNLNPY